jgi:hypothetical protein
VFKNINDFLFYVIKILVTLLFAYIFHPRIFNTSKVFHTPDQDAQDQFKFGGAGMGGGGGGGGGGPNDMNDLWNAGGGIGGMMGGAPPIPSMKDQEQQRRRRSLINDTLLQLTSTAIMFYNQAQHVQQNPHNQMYENAFTQALIPSFSTMPSLYNRNTLNKQNFGDK